MWRLPVLSAILPVFASGNECGGRIVVGVDYYPEQWPLEDMKDDMHAIKHDLGADMIRIGEFMWHELEPVSGIFNFTLLDMVIGLAEELGLEVMLGTPTATFPAWLYAQEPGIVSQGPDAAEGYAGATPAFGGRRQYSFNSETYQRYASRVVTQVARRYAKNKAVTHWQVDNELGHEGSDLDFSDQALDAWRVWLRRKYLSDVTRLNEDWGTTFWGVTYNGFNEIPLPRWTIPGGPSRPNQNFRSNQSPGMLLDYRRFRRDSITHFSDESVKILRDEKVGGCITTNAPGGFFGKAMDHNDVFAKMDMVAYDNYPVWGGSVAAPDASTVAIILDTVRGWHTQRGWMVAEQLIGAQGHDVIGYTPRPGQVKAWAAASLLHGATSINFFRYRAAVFGQEEFCYGILDHTTPRGTGRKWKEAKEVYELARAHDNLWLAPVQARVALVYDMENLFAWQAQPQSVEFSWEAEAHRLYRPFWRHGAAVDVISVSKLMAIGGAEDLKSKYDILIFPSLMLTSDDLVSLLEKYFVAGGSLWIGFRADLKDERSQMRRQASRLAALAGAAVEEIESLNPGVPSDVRTVTAAAGGNGETATVDIWREGLRTSTGAEALWKYSDDFFGAEDFAAVVRRRVGTDSEAVYIGAGIDSDSLLAAAGESLKRKPGVPRVLHEVDESHHPEVERVLRRDRDGKLWRVEINHGAKPSADIAGQTMKPYEVRIAEHTAFHLLA